MKTRQPAATPEPNDKPRFAFIRLHLGANSIFLVAFLLVCVYAAVNLDLLEWDYLKGLDQNLSFLLGFFSILLGLGIFNFWKMGGKSSYTLHFINAEFIPRDANIIYDGKDLSFAISRLARIKPKELPAFLRALICIVICFCLSLITLDNVGYKKLLQFPSDALQSASDYCPEKEDSEIDAQPIAGCELIVRAYKLGYAKDLGPCEAKKVAVEKLQICRKRRTDEPYLHYMSRLLLSSVDKKMNDFNKSKAQFIADKFELQLHQLKALKDYQTYAISAAPRASHHIWTDLPYPNHVIIQKYREYLQPNHCIKEFQNQTNTVQFKTDDERRYSKLLEHVYGQLLFNPKGELTVGFCKEFKIHWNADPNICNRLADHPRVTLQAEGILPDVELVLRRHDVVNDILTLDQKIKELEQNIDSTIYKTPTALLLQKSEKKQKNLIIKSKIAKAKQQIRKKNEIVSFQCFMQGAAASKNTKKTFTLDDTQFLVRTHFFELTPGKGESQIAMYDTFSKLMETRFHYSTLSSRTDIMVEKDGMVTPVVTPTSLDRSTYLLARLEVLKNVDIFLGNNWVLDRDDLLDVYPYHVHLQNYVKTFRSKYSIDHGRI